jgi:hypothetical protein
MAPTDTPSDRRPTRWPSVAAATLLAAVLPVYVWRLTLGVDLGDESYYAVTPVSWLRSTPAETGNLSLHQLSGALTYPFVKAYAWFRPDLQGLIIALRGLYGVSALGVALLAYRLFARLLPPLAAAGCAGALLLFIPFGLPAPSYNTLGMLGMIGGVCVVGRLILEREANGVTGVGYAHLNRGPETTPGLRRVDWRGAVLAGALFVIGSEAYPSLVVLPAVSLALFAGLFARQRRLLLVVFACWSALGLAALVALVAGLGGPERLARMLAFTDRIDGTSVLGGKFRRAAAMLTSSPLYLGFCAAVVGLGSVRRLLPCLATRVLHLGGVAAIAGWLLYRAATPIFATRGHDLVFLLAAAGLPALPVPGRPLTPAGRVVAALYLIGLVGGLVTSCTAYHSLFNFCLLGILSVAAGMAAWLIQPAAGTVLDRLIGPAWALALAALVGWSSLQYVYGEGDLGQVRLSARLREGPFAGLRTRRTTADVLGKVSRQVEPYRSRCHTVEVFGLPGPYLLAPFELRSPMPYPLQDHATRRACELLTRHYAEPGHRPDLIVWFRNVPLELNRVQVELVEREYQEVGKEEPVTVYLRRDALHGADR